MAQSIRPLGDYLDLLEQRGLLVSRPAGLDLTAPVALVMSTSTISLVAWAWTTCSRRSLAAVPAVAPAAVVSVVADETWPSRFR